LEILPEQPEIDHGYIGIGHMFPSSDGIFLEGAFDSKGSSLKVSVPRVRG